MPKQVGVRIITPLSPSSGACTVTSALLPPCSVSFQRDEGIIRLNSCFQWREFEGDDQRQKIHQEFVYENVMYSVQRGLPWAAVAQIANLSKELLPELRGESWLLNTCFTNRLFHLLNILMHIYISTIILLSNSWIKTPCDWSSFDHFFRLVKKINKSGIIVIKSNVFSEGLGPVYTWLCIFSDRIVIR